jgi:site-specific DNA recombinase
MGKSACKGRSIPMDRLDQLVTSHIADYLLLPGRVADLLAEIVKRRAMASGEVRDRIDLLSREARTAEDKLRRLYTLVEEGVTDLDEVLKVRIADIKADRDRARSALDRIKGQSPAARIDRAKIERFGSLMRQNITTGDVPFRKAYLRSFIDAVEVDDHVIRIHGSKSTLEQAVIASSQAGTNGVRSFVRKWRSLGESNPCFSLEREGCPLEHSGASRQRNKLLA